MQKVTIFGEFNLARQKMTILGKFNLIFHLAWKFVVMYSLFHVPDDTLEKI